MRILYLCIDLCSEQTEGLWTVCGVSTYSWDVVARWSISCKELQKMLNSDAASVSWQDFHAEMDITILEEKNNVVWIWLQLLKKCRDSMHNFKHWCWKLHSNELFQLTDTDATETLKGKWKKKKELWAMFISYVGDFILDFRASVGAHHYYFWKFFQEL